MTSYVKRVFCQNSNFVKNGQILTKFDTYGCPEWFYAVFVRKNPRWSQWRHNCRFLKWFNLLEILYWYSCWCAFPYYVVFTLIENPIWPLWKPFWFSPKICDYYSTRTTSGRDTVAAISHLKNLCDQIKINRGMVNLPSASMFSFVLSKFLLESLKGFIQTF